MPAGAAHQPCASSASKSSRRESLPLSVSATQLALPLSTQPSCASLSSPFFSPRSLSDFRHCSLCSYVRHGGVWRSIYLSKTPFSSLNLTWCLRDGCRKINNDRDQHERQRKRTANLKRSP